MYQGAPKDVASYLSKMGRKVPTGENSLEYLIDVIQEYDQSDVGVEAIAEFASTGVKPAKITEGDASVSIVVTAVSPTPLRQGADRLAVVAASGAVDDKGRNGAGKRLYLQASRDDSSVDDFDHSVRTPYNDSISRSWTASHSGVVQKLKFTPPARLRKNDQKLHNPMR